VLGAVVGAVGAVVVAVGAVSPVATSTSHSLAAPTAGSPPKNAFVHDAAPETVIWIHWVPVPYRTVWPVPTVNDPYSPATWLQDPVDVDVDVGAGVVVVPVVDVVVVDVFRRYRAASDIESSLDATAASTVSTWPWLPPPQAVRTAAESKTAVIAPC